MILHAHPATWPPGFVADMLAPDAHHVVFFAAGLAVGAAARALAARLRARRAARGPGESTPGG